MTQANIWPLTNLLRYSLISVLLFVLTACGGGSGGNDAGGGPGAPLEPTNPPELTRAQLISASKFASRASFGLSYEAIEILARDGEQAWLEQQFSLPVGLHTPTVDDLIQRRDAGEFSLYESDFEYLIQFRRLAWWNCAIQCQDTLRQRIAFALSEIFVVSDTVDALIVDPYALSTYYDTLLRNAFGNFRQLLGETARHPAMGVYLSHINNNKANLVNNTFPDENFAREVMQLFSIGLFELNIDGSAERDINGRPIASYNNDDIREFAKMFTGFSYGGPNAFFGSPFSNFQEPMQMFDDHHEDGEKHLLNGAVVPAGQSGMQDFEQTMDNLFNHPNVGPFISKQMIQRLVTSNPSPAYIERVARAFNGDSTGIRGDMKALIRAILNDPEALAVASSFDNFGKLREPIVRYLNILRIFGASSDDGFIANSGYFFQAVTRQHPLSSPSVFNFFLPAHSPTGELAAAGLAAPEFQITNSSTIINFTNLIDAIALADFVTETPQPFAPAHLNLDDYVQLAENVDELVERLDLLLTYGTMEAGFKQVVSNLLNDIPDRNLRVRLALYMFLTSADYAVEL